MKLYELNYLVSPNLTETEVKNFQEKISSLIQERGVLTNVQSPRKRILAYPIKKNNLALFGTLNFQMESENLADFEKKLNREPGLIRYLILGKIKSKLIRIRKKPQDFVKKIVEPKKKKVEIGEIEKKLEEILKE